MCELCNDIKTMIYDDDIDGWPPENTPQIIKDKDGNFHIWETGNGDSLYAGINEEFSDIVYCPKCGRNLRED